MKKQFTKLIGACFALILLLTGTTGAQAQYCEVAASDLDDDWISNVTFAGINHDSGQSLYSDFTDIVGTVVAGATYPMSATINYSDEWDQYLTVFIDFNQDEDFDDEGERFDIGNCVGPAACVISGDITIPAAIPGLTRMRVIENFNGYTANACTNNAYMEVEDYSILVDGDCSPPQFSYEEVDNCVDFTYNVNATLNDFGGNSFVTVYMTRSDGVPVDFVTLPDFIVGQTVSLIEDVPFGVEITASIEGTDPTCNVSAIWTENGLCPPQNDLCVDAIVADCGGTYEGSTVNASVVEGQEFCAGTTPPTATNGGVWYTFELDATYVVDLDLSGSLYDTKMWLYSGSCEGLTCIVGDDDGGEGVDSRIQGTYAEGTYYVYITGFTTARGDYIFNYSCEELLCVAPIATAVAVDDADAEIEGCLSFGETHRVLVSLDGGEGNDTYTVTVGDSTVTMVSPGTHIFGDYTVGSAVNVSIGGDQDPLCDQTLTVPAVPICPPANDLCADAFEAVCGGETYGGSTIGASATEGQTYCGTTTPSATNGGVWYTLSLESTTEVDIDLSGSLYDTKLFLYSGSCDGLECIDGDDDGGDGADSRIIATLPGGEYFIYISGFSSSRGEYVMNVTCVDIECDAPAATISAVDDADQEIEGCLPFGETHRVMVELTGGEGNDTYSVTVGDSTVVMSSPGSHIFGDYVVGSNVSVDVFGDQDSACDQTYSITVPVCPAANDLCADAIEAVCGVEYTGTTVGATAMEGQAYCGTTAPSVGNGGVWYSFSIENELEVDIDLSGSLYDTKLFLYSGTCEEMTCVDGDDDGGDGADSRIQTTLLPGEYLIYVTGFSANSGSYVLNIGCVNVACIPEVSAAPVDVNGDPIDGCLDIADEYYVMVALSAGSGNDFYNVSVNDGEPVQIAADGTGIVGPVSAADAANVSVSGVTDPTCAATASTSVVICPPGNDLCVDAFEAVCGVQYEGTTVDATAMEGQPYCGTTAPAAANGGVWYSFEVDGQTEVDIDLSGSLYDTKLFLYSGTCDGLTCVDGDDDGGDGVDSRIQTTLGSGTYYIYVTGFSSNRGLYVMNISCIDLACVPDAAAVPVDVNGDAIEACLDMTGEYYVLVSLTGGADNDFYNVSVNGGEPIQVAPESSGTVGPVSASVVANISVSGDTDPTCATEVTTSVEVCAPSNDLCGDAIAVSCGEVVEGTTVASTASDSPGTCITTPGSGGGIWYSIIGTGSDITASLCGSTYDTKINVYEGSCESLVCVTGNDDSCGLQSEVTWESQSGVEYLIYVNGFLTNVGSFTLTMSCEGTESPSIDGTVDWIETCSDRNVTVSLYTPDTDVLVGAFNGVVNSSGAFTITDLPEGTFDVIAKVEGSLAVGFTDFVIAAGPNALDLGTVQRGDLNGDNGINIIDFSLINASFNSVIGDANYNPLADLNCSGGVNILDVSILSPGFLQTGAVAPLD